MGSSDSRFPHSWKDRAPETHLVVVQSQAEFALIGTQVVFHEVGILGRRRPLHDSPGQCLGTILSSCCPRPWPTLLMSMVSRASCRSRSLRSRLLSEAEATPPLPVLPPGRCWKSMVQVWARHSRGETWWGGIDTEAEGCVLWWGQ